MARLLCSIAVLVLAAACAKAPPPPARNGPLTPAEPRATDDEEVLPLGKLPPDVTPTAYDVTLVVDPRSADFAGDVAIHVTMSRPRDHVWLHGRGLRVKRAQLTLADGRVVAAAWQQMTPDGLARLSFGQTLAAQDVTIVVGYDASVSTRGEGLYTVTTDGEPYVFSQFEATSARLCFPSFDEPRFKTPFDLTLVVPEGMAAISATHVASDTSDAGHRRVRFARTEKLPTYLVAFAVGAFDIVDAGSLPPTSVRNRPLPLRGIAVRGRGPMLRYALEHVGPILRRLEDYFGTAYPFDKLDIIAAPEFAYGGMENAGAPLFLDKSVMLDPATATLEERRDYAELMAHELAHMWFGDTVTMQWWDDTWLNEAFTNWMGYRTAEALDASLGSGAAASRAVLASMNADSLAAARQIRQPVESNHDIANAFDSITYDKGMGVLAMFEAYIGAEKFRDAVHAYLQRYRFANATADDFFAVLGEAAGAPVSLALRTFVEQPGVPLVAVALTCEPHAKPRLSLEQTRYLPLGSEGDATRTWGVPVCVRYGVQSRAHRECWMIDAPKATVELAETTCPTWLMPNAEAAGYYRFALPTADTASLTRALEAGKLSRAEIVAFVDSLTASVAAGRASPADLFALLPILTTRRELDLDRLAMSAVDTVHERYADEDVVPLVEQWARELWKGKLTEDFRRVPSETAAGRDRRTKLMEFLTTVGREPSLMRDAAKRGRSVLTALEGDKPIDGLVDVALAGTVLGAAINEDGAPLQERVIALLAKQSDPQVREELIDGLASARDPTLVRRALDVTLTDWVRGSELWSLSQPLSHDRASAATTWAWLQEHFEAVKAKVPEDQEGYLIYSAMGFCSDERAAEVEAFFAPRVSNLVGGPRVLAEVREAITLCAARSRVHHDVIRGFFTTRPPADGRHASVLQDAP